MRGLLASKEERAWATEKVRMRRQELAGVRDELCYCKEDPRYDSLYRQADI